MRLILTAVFLFAFGLSGCATGQGPAYLTTASLPDIPKLLPATMLVNQPTRQPPPPVLANKARHSDGLGVAGPSGPVAPRYRAYNWNGNHQRLIAQSATQGGMIAANSPGTVPPRAVPAGLSWRTSPRMAPDAAARMAKLIATPGQPKTILVRPGDTLASLARDHHTTMSQLITINALSSAQTIQTGQTLRIP